MASVAELLKSPIIALQNAFLCADCDAISTRGDQCPHCTSKHAMLSLSSLLSARGDPTVDTSGIEGAISSLEAALTDPPPLFLAPSLTIRFTKRQDSRYSSSMREYSQDEVLKELRDQVDASSQLAVAATLGVSSVFISYVLTGKRALPADLALKLGFIKQPDRYLHQEATEKAAKKPVKAATAKRKKQ
jgi:plasmid maintenance system antidote protein VapI